MFVVWNFKNINWKHVEFDEGKFLFLPFFSYISHLEWNGDLTFLKASTSHSSEMQYNPGIRRVQINTERKNWIGCSCRSNRYVYDASFTNEYLHHRTTIRAESVGPLRRNYQWFPRSPFSMLIHIILARTPLLSATLKQGVERGNCIWIQELMVMILSENQQKINVSAVNGWMKQKREREAVQRILALIVDLTRLKPAVSCYNLRYRYIV